MFFFLGGNQNVFSTDLYIAFLKNSEGVEHRGHGPAVIT